MRNLLTDYPSVPWKQGWRLSSGANDTSPIFTGDAPGEIAAPDATWRLQLTQSSLPVMVQLFSNGLIISIRNRKKEKQIIIFLIEPGVLIGMTQGFPLPEFHGEEIHSDESGVVWLKTNQSQTVYLAKESKFTLVSGTFPEELALRKAEEALEINFLDHLQEECERREKSVGLFSINPHHNPPVALAAESLRQRLRDRTGAIHGLWSTSDGFDNETFFLNELYPLIRAWRLIEPDIALELAQTAISLQQSTGGFPSWVDCQGVVSAAAPWPMIIQSFEIAWQITHDSILLKKTLPALRKYMQWALRRFDPHRDGIPAWQSELEVFVPDTFERDKATPDLTVLLIGELEALLRLCEESDHSEAVIETLTDEHTKLTQTLTTIFWNPERKAFSNVWKNGHLLQESSFGSFLPLFWPALPANFKTPLLENFEETHGFPGQSEPTGRKQEEIEDSPYLPVIHQFMAFESLRCADRGRALLMLFVRRARAGFAAWFERESIEAARLERHQNHSNQPAYSLGPITAALILTTQHEFQHETKEHTSIRKNIQRLIHRLRFTRTDLRIILTVCVAIILVHLLYNNPNRIDISAKMSEALLNYQQGHFSEALQTCRRYPDNAISQFLRANLFMLINDPASAEPLYRQALLAETESPSALFGYALSLQMNGKFTDAIHRYNDFIDIHDARLSRTKSAQLIDLAYEYIRLAEEKFKKPPHWKRVYTLPVMNDLGL